MGMSWFLEGPHALFQALGRAVLESHGEKAPRISSGLGVYRSRCNSLLGEQKVFWDA